jgi:hypothetical protein
MPPPPSQSISAYPDVHQSTQAQSLQSGNVPALLSQPPSTFIKVKTFYGPDVFVIAFPSRGASLSEVRNILTFFL